MRKTVAMAAAIMMFCAGTAVAEDYLAPEDAVIAGVFSAMGTGDIETAIGLFSEDAVYVSIPAPPPWEGKAGLVGPEQIGWWLGFLAKDNSTIDIYNLTVDGNRVSFTGDFASDHLREEGIDVVPLDGVAILKDGLIQGLMWY